MTAYTVAGDVRVWLITGEKGNFSSKTWNLEIAFGQF